jgi:hypothetical protein
VELCIESNRVPKTSGFAWLVILPIVMLTGAISTRQKLSQPLLATGLLVATLVYFGLNFAFFDFPWPWLAPTGRTVSAWIFIVDSVFLLSCVIWVSGNRKRPEQPFVEEAAG